MNIKQPCHLAMKSDFEYPRIPGTHVRPASSRFPDEAKLTDLLRSVPPPTPGGKHIFAFWRSGIGSLPPYLLRNVLAWHHRLSPLGWNIYLLDDVPSSRLNVSNYIDTTSPLVVPEIYTAGKLSGEYAAQHTSDLVRYPLLLKYGGVYLDVGILQFGDLDYLWTQHLANPSSPIDFMGFTLGSPPAGITICNFAFACTANNPLVLRAHKILLALWKGKTSTTGMHKHPLVNHLDLMRVPKEVVVADEGKDKMMINDESMTDYAIQIQAMGAAQRWLDLEENWDGPKYTRKHCWLYSMLEEAMQFEQLGGWNGKLEWDLFNQNLPGPGEEETERQALARKIVEETVAKGWCMKLGHGFSAKLFGGDTLGMLWRKNVGSDCLEGTYAGWSRWAERTLEQDERPRRMEVPEYDATVVAKLEDFL